MTELPSSIKADNPYHEEILQRGRSVLRMLGVDSAFLEGIPEYDFGIAKIELIGLFDKYLVEKLGLQYLTDKPEGYDSTTMGHLDTRLNRPTQFGTLDLWNGMKEKFEMERRVSGKPYPVNLENLNRDTMLAAKQQYGVDIKIPDFIKAAEAAVAPVNLSPLFDKGDTKEMKYVKELLRSKGNQEIEQVLTAKFAEEDKIQRPLSTLEFLMYFTTQLHNMVLDSGVKIFRDDVIEEEDEEDEIDQENIEDEDEEDAVPHDEELENELNQVPMLPEQVVPDDKVEDYAKEEHDDHPLLHQNIQPKDDMLLTQDIFEDPEWDEKVNLMEDCYEDLNYNIANNPVFLRRVKRDQLQNREPESVAEKYALEDVKALMDLEQNIYNIRECFLCKFDLRIEPMNVPLIRRFLNGSGEMYSRKQMKTCRKHHNKVASVIKRARAMGIISEKDVFRIRSPFDTEEVDLQASEIPRMVFLTEQEADDLEKDRVVRGVFNPFESYCSGVKIMINDNVDWKKLANDEIDEDDLRDEDGNLLGADRNEANDLDRAMLQRAAFRYPVTDS